MGLFCSYSVEPTDHEIRLFPGDHPKRIWIVIKRPLLSADTFALVAFAGEPDDNVKIHNNGYWIDEALVDDEHVQFTKRGHIDAKLLRKLRELIYAASSGGVWKPIARLPEARVLPAITEHEAAGYKRDDDEPWEDPAKRLSDADLAKLSIVK